MRSREQQVHVHLPAAMGHSSGSQDQQLNVAPMAGLCMSVATESGVARPVCCLTHISRVWVLPAAFPIKAS